jgi:DNA-binding transcriptional MerR regulator
MMRTDAIPSGKSGDLDKPLYSVNVASEMLSSNPDTLLIYEGLGLATPKHVGSYRRRYTSRDILGLTALRRLTRHGLNLTGARYVIRYLQLLDAQHMPRPLEFANIHVEHVRL